MELVAAAIVCIAFSLGAWIGYVIEHIVNAPPPPPDGYA